MAFFNRLANVELQAFRRNQSHRKFAGMKGDVNLWIDAVQVIDHAHVQFEIVHGDIPVLGHDQI